MRTVEINEKHLKKIIPLLIKESTPFQAEPLPFDKWKLTHKTESQSITDLVDSVINASQNWRVDLYDEDDILFQSWVITDRTENEAEKEALADIKNEFHEQTCDWTMTPFEVGDKVYWKDPDQDLSSGVYKIVKVSDRSDIVLIHSIPGGASEAEVPLSEIQLITD